MKKIVLILVLHIGSVIFSFGFSQNANGKVYFFQCPGCTHLVGFFIDRKIVCSVSEKSFSIHEVEPGEHTFCVQENSDTLNMVSETRSISINIEAGKIYYVEVIVLLTGTGSEYYISEVPDGTYNRVVTKKYKQIKDCK